MPNHYGPDVGEYDVPGNGKDIEEEEEEEVEEEEDGGEHSHRHRIRAIWEVMKKNGDCAGAHDHGKPCRSKMSYAVLQ